MALTNPFEKFQIKPTSFKTKTTNSALNTLSAPAQDTLTESAVSPLRKLGTKPVAPATSSKAPKLNTTLSSTADQQEQQALSKQGTTQTAAAATTGGAPGSAVPTGETDQPTNPTGNDPFDYSGYGSGVLTGPITEVESERWTGETRTRYNALQSSNATLQSQIDAINKLEPPYRNMTAEERGQERLRLQQLLDQQKAEQEKLLGDFRSEYATQHAGDDYLDILNDFIKNWDTSYTNDTTIQPFESEWASIFGDAFGDLADFGSSTDFLQSFVNNFGLDEIITGQVNWGDYGFDNYTPDALLKFLQDGSNIPGFEWKDGDPNVSNEQEFIKFIMDEAKTIRDKVGSFDWTQIFGEVGPEMGERMKAALNLINSPGITQQERDAIIKRNMATVTRDAEAQKREYDLMIGTQLAGQSTKSSYYRRLVDRDVMMARAQVEGDLTELDVNLRQQNYQKGLEELGSISRDKMNAMLESMQIAGTREGQVLNFLAQVGQIAVGSKQTEYQHYENRLKMAQDMYLQNADRMLKEKLGQAELDLKQFDIKTNEGLEKMRTAYQTALQNRGMNIDEAKANADQLLETYKIGQSFAKMDMERLAQLADLAAKAQEGDRQAWGAYNSMMLEERLKNRGMDIEEAQSVSQLAYGIWSTNKQQAMTMWVERYRGQLERDLVQMQLDNQPSPWLQAVGQLFGGIGNIIPLLKGTGTTNTPDVYTPPGDFNTQPEVNA